MDSALLHTPDGPYICSAQELCEWDPITVDAATQARRFTCTGCPTHLFPKAYVRPAKRQAHFSLYGDGRHTSDCLLELYKAVLKRKANRDADDADPTAVRHPVKLASIPAESTTPACDLEELALAGDRFSTRSSDVDTASSTAPRPLRSRLIRAFADAYLDMNRAQRLQAEIDLPGVTDALHYQYAFRRLWSIERLRSRRVFYTQLRWTTDIDDTGTAYRITLNAGDGYNEDSKRFERPWTLVAHHDQWTAKGRSLFLDEYKTAVNQARNDKLKPWVFTLAEQGPDDLAELHVSVRQHIAFIPLSRDRSPSK